MNSGDKVTLAGTILRTSVIKGTEMVEVKVHGRENPIWIEADKVVLEYDEPCPDASPR